MSRAMGRRRRIAARERAAYDPLEWMAPHPADVPVCRVQWPQVTEPADQVTEPPSGRASNADNGDARGAQVTDETA